MTPSECSEKTARENLYGLVLKTDLTYARKMPRALGCDVYLKREDEQPVHSFKIRGAYNKMRQLAPSELARGVLAVSAGNHAQGVAISASVLGTTATVFMPETAPQIKVDEVRSYGAEVVLSGKTYSDAEAAALSLVASSGRVLIHPIDRMLTGLVNHAPLGI